MSVEQRRFYELLAPSIESVGCELLGVHLSRGKQHTVLRLYIDSEQGITIDDCTRVSHQVSGVLDVEDPIAGEYSLEVSSPGDDRPLFRLEHYQRFIGHDAKLRLAMPVDGRRAVVGKIVSVDGERVVVEEDEVQWALTLEQIASARLVPGS